MSHWQATNRGPGSLYLHNEKAVLPETADIVIVGGGMMGAAMAYFLTRAGGYGENKKIVCVEAKDVASGASEKTSVRADYSRPERRTVSDNRIV